jgi:hypothetical protein
VIHGQRACLDLQLQFHSCSNCQSFDALHPCICIDGTSVTGFSLLRCPGNLHPCLRHISVSELGLEEYSFPIEDCGGHPAECKVGKGIKE